MQSLNKSNKRLSFYEFCGYNDEINEIINKEKINLKYRILFINYFSLKYLNIINKCFSETFNEIDKWIIANITRQNNILNKFINYLKENLNNKKNYILEYMDFNQNNFDKTKVNLSLIYEKMFIKEILDIYNTPIEHKLIQKESLNYSELFVYNLNDLIFIYNSLKEYGSNTNYYLVKYNIVYDLFIKKYLIQKGFKLLPYNNNEEKNINSNIIKRSLIMKNNENIININSNKDSNSVSKGISNISTSRSKNNICENIMRGISKKLINLTNSEYNKFLSLFSIFDNKYININELFTVLLILGSKLISSKKFLETIPSSLVESKKDKRILLTKDEFMNINFWFENDEYLNIPCNEEEELYINFDKLNNKNYDKEYKINKIKESIFNINKEENYIDIEILVNLLEKINEKNDKDNSNKENNEKLSIKEPIELMEKFKFKNNKFIKSINNNIFDCIFKN